MPSIFWAVGTNVRCRRLNARVQKSDKLTHDRSDFTHMYMSYLKNVRGNCSNLVDMSNKYRPNNLGGSI